ncbi:hypothetical protein D3C84_875490 [compost metagenome]
MDGGGIALVPGDAITGVDRIQLGHFPITADLGQDGSRSDGRYLAISLDHRSAGHLELGAAVAIDQRQLRRHAEPLHRTLHRQHGGMQDVQLIDLLHLGTGDAPGKGLLADFVEQRIAARFRELLRIVQAEDRPRRVEDDRSGHHRTTERATADFVDAGHQLFHQAEIQTELHQGTPINCRMASAAWRDASWRSER